MASKIYTFVYVKPEKKFERISLENGLCHFEDKLKKERVAIIKDVLHFVKMRSAKKYKYLPMILMPSKLFIVSGCGLTADILNSLTKEELKMFMAQAVQVNIHTEYAFGYLRIKDQKERWRLNKDIVLKIPNYVPPVKKGTEPKWFTYKDKIEEILNGIGFELFPHHSEVMLILKRGDMQPDWKSKWIDKKISLKDFIGSLKFCVEETRFNLDRYKEEKEKAKQTVDFDIVNEQIDVIVRLEMAIDKIAGMKI